MDCLGNIYDLEGQLLTKGTRVVQNRVPRPIYEVMEWQYENRYQNTGEIDGAVRVEEIDSGRTDEFPLYNSAGGPLIAFDLTIYKNEERDDD